MPFRESSFDLLFFSIHFLKFDATLSPHRIRWLNLPKLTMSLFAVADINECTTNTHNCHHNANCTNRNGSFTCECWNGFNGDGENCTGRCNQFSLFKFDATSSP